MRRKVIAFAAMTVLCLAGALQAQSPNATVTGRITDPSGAVVPNATLTIVNTATGISYSGKTNGAGIYSVTNLLPGIYRMQAEARGFKTVVKPGVVLHVQQVAEINLQLAVGSVTELVTVQAGAPLVQLATSSVSAIVNSATVRELPLNGRDWTQLAALQPGVNALTTQRPVGATIPRGNRGFGQQMDISGTRPQLNNYRLDGISIVDYANSTPASVIGVTPGVDAIGEFSVSTANASAQYGRTGGGVINAITKSGTNQFHGDAYWFLRDEALDAANFFDNFANLPKASFHRNQFGASAGGPIQKDKTFFFGDYEGFRQILGASTVDDVPSPDARNGIIHNADGTTCTIGVLSPGCALTNSAGTVGVDPQVKPFLGFYPLPNDGLIAPGNTGLFAIALNTSSIDNFYTARIDRTISEKDSVFGTWFWDKSQNEAPDPLDDLFDGNNSGRFMVSLQETHVFSPSLVNSLRGGFSRVAALVTANLAAINPLVTNTSLGTFPGFAAAAVQRIPGVTDFIGEGIGADTGNVFKWNSFQAYDDVFLAKGVHSIKFGFAFERMQTYDLTSIQPTGLFTFGSLTDFLTNKPGTFTGGVPGFSSNPRGYRQSLFGGYIQDDWRWRPNLTLNLGLRYEAVTVPTEVQNKLVNLRAFTSPPPGHLGSPLFNNPTLRNFEPRVGFAWDPFHDGKTAVRGAFGIFDALPLTYEFLQTGGPPFLLSISASSLAPGSFPKLSAILAAVGPQKLNTSSIEFNPSRNYIMIWNLNVEHQLNSSTSVMVGYVGNHGVHMENVADEINMVLPTATSQGYLWPSPAGSGTVLNPAVGEIDGVWWGGGSQYAALEAQVTKIMSHGFQAQGSYTWGKSIDTGSATAQGDPYLNSISSPLWWGCNSCRRGLSDYNISQTLAVNYLWNVPTPTRWGAIGSHLLGGWGLGGIITAETGVPITPILGGDPLGTNDHDPWAYPNRLIGPGCGSDVNPGNPINYIKLNCFAVPMATPAIAAQCTSFSAVRGSCANLMGNGGRNSVIGPGLLTWDASLVKNTYIKRISENFDVQLRAEFFNILNRANFETPIDNSALFDSTGAPVGGAGSIDKTSTAAREIQFALKLIW